MKKYLAAAAAVLLIVLTVAYYVMSRPTSHPIRIGYLSISAATPLFVAQREGIFEKHGLSVQLVEFRTSNEVAAAAAGGHIDLIGIGATNAVLDTMNGSGASFQLFLANLYVRRPNAQSTDFLLAREGINDFRDLRGKTVAFFPGSVGHVFAEEIFPRRGVPLGDIRYVEMAPPQWLPALLAGRIDAVTALEPYSTVIMENLAVNVIIDGYYAEVMPRAPVSGAWFIEGRLSADQEGRVIVAYGEALQRIASDRNAAVQALIAFTDTEPRYARSIRLNDWGFTTDPQVREAALRFADLFARRGGISRVPARDWLWEPR